MGEFFKLLLSKRRTRQLSSDSSLDTSPEPKKLKVLLRRKFLFLFPSFFKVLLRSNLGIFFWLHVSKMYVKVTYRAKFGVQIWPGSVFICTAIFVNVLPPQPRTQACSRYPSGQRRLGTERDSARRPGRIFPTSLTGDVTSEIAEDDWERGFCRHYSIQKMTGVVFEGVGARCDVETSTPQNNANKRG